MNESKNKIKKKEKIRKVIEIINLIILKMMKITYLIIIETKTMIIIERRIVVPILKK